MTMGSDEYQQQQTANNRSDLSPATDNNSRPHAAENSEAGGIGREDEGDSDTISKLSHLHPHIMDRSGYSSVEGMIKEAREQPGGVAIDGLRKLMKTTTEYDALDQWDGPDSDPFDHGRSAKDNAASHGGNPAV